MHTFLKEAKRKQKWITLARIHRRLDWPANRILSIVLRAFWSIMFQQKCAYWDTSGFQEVLPWPSSLRKVRYRQYTRSERFIGHWWPKKWVKTCKSIFLKKRSLDVSLGPYRETSVSKIPLLPKNRFLFTLGRPIRNMLSIFQDDRSTTLSNKMGLF